MKYYIYAIKSLKNNSIYVGMTKDIYNRLNYHNSGYVFSTKGYRPYKLIYFEECENRLIARKIEKYWKSGIGKEKLKAL